MTLWRVINMYKYKTNYLINYLKAEILESDRQIELEYSRQFDQPDDIVVNE